MIFSYFFDLNICVFLLQFLIHVFSLVLLAENGLCKNSKGFRRTELSIYHLAKFTIFSLFNRHAKLKILRTL